MEPSGKWLQKIALPDVSLSVTISLMVKPSPSPEAHQICSLQHRLTFLPRCARGLSSSCG